MGSTIPPELTRPDVRTAIVEAMAATYEISQERHDPTVGDDNMIFGQHVWKTGSHFLKKGLSGLPDCRADYVNQSLDIQIGRVRLRHHKLGDSDEDDPARCFPNHPGPASRLGPEQLELNLPRGAGRPQEYLGWVIASYGNPEDGLRRIYLQAVGSVRALDGTIAHWEEIIPIFEAAPLTEVEIEAKKMMKTKAEPVIAPEPEVGLHEEGEEAQDDRGKG
jgi:hypothetical protein